MHPNPRWAIRRKKAFALIWRFHNMGNIIEWDFKTRQEALDYMKNELQLKPIWMYEVFPCSRKKIGLRSITIQ